MPYNITRREFLRYSAAALSALWFAPLLPEAGGKGKAASPQQAPGQPQIVQGPSVEPLPPPALLGTPVDVAIGTDGVFWVVGESGAPSTYDPLQGVWQPFGGGIDAAAHIPFVDGNENFSVSLCFFRGAEVYRSGAPAPVPIASLWPKLPPSFQQGIDGATYVSGNLFFLFGCGQVAEVDVWGGVAVYPLTDFGSAGWPGGPWQDGLFDYVVSGKDDSSPGYVIFVCSGQFIVADLDQGLILSAPQPLSAHFGGAALTLLEQGNIQAGLFAGPVLATGAPFQLFNGPVLYTLQDTESTAPAQPGYIAQAFSGWPQAWHPVLQQAPAGAIGNLWGLTHNAAPVVNGGSGWNLAPLPNSAPALAIDAGAGGIVYAISAGALFQLDVSGGWTQAAAPSFALQGVSVGDAEHVWVTDTAGSVYRFQSGAFTQANLGVAASDIKANPDGTLWHCSAGAPDAYRYLSEGQLPSEPIALGQGTTSVLKVASTSFGTGYFLAQQNGQSALVRYTSPYLFKTSASYWSAGVDTIAVGAASIFMFIATFPNNYHVAALDAQTGVERWRYAYPVQSDNNQFAPAYDSQHQLVYVFIDVGIVSALDAHTGSVVWSLQLSYFTAAQPLLAGGMIYIPGTSNPNSNQTVYLTAIDAADAARRAAAGGTPVTAWSTPMLPEGNTPTPAPPVYVAGYVYCAAWSADTQGTYFLSLFKLDAATGSILWTNDNAFYMPDTWTPSFVAPILSTFSTLQVLLVNVAQGVAAFELEAGQQVWVYLTANHTTGASIDSALVLYDKVVYCSDSTGLLYALDTNLNPVAGSPYQVANSPIKSGLRIIPDSAGKAIAIFGDPATDNLNFYSTATNNVAALATSQTRVNLLSEVTPDGIIYVAGFSSQEVSDSLGQVFAIRTQDVGGLRDFVIESQLMQDYDPGAVAVARYQTRITMVDNNKTLLPFTDVKIWSDDPLTVLVDGQSFNIGPNTPVSTHADATGSLTIASVATDLFVTPLRIWAAFMDPFERIVIYPDQEFHGRLPSMIADPNNDDPTLINLATGKNYAGTQVFTDQQQAQAVATAVSGACQAAGIAGTGAGSTGGTIGAALPPYVAYADLPGMHYSPYNTPANRSPIPQNPYGVSWSSDTPAAYAVLPFAAAANAIDALSGAVDPSLPASIGSGLGSIFSGLWHKIKSGVAKISKVIVSVGNAVYTGIQYVEDGVTKVFRFVVREIEDVAATVGAFFIALGKALEDVIELLSLLLHFEEVVKTHAILKSAILGQINSLPATIQASIQPALDGFFAKGEQAIQQAFCTVKQQIVAGFTCSAPQPAASPPVSNFSGIGATAHTIFSVAPKNGGSAGSHAVSATWGFDKVRSHYRQASTPGAAAIAGNPILDFVNAFANSLANDPTLNGAYTATLNDFAASFAFKSSSEFLQMAVFDLLDVVQDLLLSSLVIGKALLDGLLALANDIVTFLIDPTQGILVQPLDIPILSDLYKLLFGSQLTFLDLVILVASIPVTFLYRIVEGQWLSEQVAGQVAGAQLTLTPLARALGLLNGAFFFGRAILMPINDTTGQPGAPNPITSYSLAVISTGFFATTMLKAAHASDLIFAATALGLVVTPYFLAAAPAVASFLSLVRIGGFIFDMVEYPSADALLVLGGNVLGSLPALAQPLKYFNDATDDISLAVLLALEIIGNLGAGFVAVIDTTVNWDAAPTSEPPMVEPQAPSRLFVPFVSAWG